MGGRRREVEEVKEEQTVVVGRDFVIRKTDNFPVVDTGDKRFI